MKHLLPAGLLLLSATAAAQSSPPLPVDTLVARRPAVALAAPDSLPSWLYGRLVCHNPAIITTYPFVFPAFTTLQPLLTRIAGVQVTPYSGAPGAWSAVRIRGITSVSGSSQPLYVVDGVPVYNYDPTPESWTGLVGPVYASPATYLQPVPSSPAPNPLLDMPLEDIEQIEVVKGAAATAQYGGQGNNGVIRISTRRGADGGSTVQTPRLRYAGWGGVQQVRQRYDLLSARQFAELANVAAPYSRRPAPYSATDLAALQEVDWQDELFRVAAIQSHHLSLDGRTAHRTRYYASTDYLRQTGVVRGSDLGRYHVRANVEQPLGDKLTVGLNASGSQTDQHHPGYEPDAATLLRQVLLAVPAVPARLSNGTTLTPDPLRDVNTSEHPGRTRRLLAQLHATYQLTPDLKLRAFGSYERAAIHDRYLSDYTATTSYAGAPLRRYIRRDSVDVGVTSWVAGTELRYQRTLAERHVLTAEARYWRQQYILEEESTVWKQSYNPATGPSGPTGSLERGWLQLKQKNLPLHSPGAVLTYAYAGRYEVEASVRSDLYFKREETEGKAYWFPGGAVRWHAHKEAFLRDVSAVEALTLHAGYGQTGNALFNPYFLRGYGAVFQPGPGGGFVPYEIPPDRTTQLDAGLHLRLWGGKLGVEANAYERRTEHAQHSLHNDLGGAPSTQGVPDLDLRSRGLELTLSSYWMAGQLRGQTSVATATTRNELRALRTGSGLEYRHRVLEVGQPVDRLLVREQAGTYPASDPSAGQIRLLSNTATAHGNGLPRYTLNVYQQIDWRKWQLLAQLDGLFGYELYNRTLQVLDAPTGITNASALALDYWTPTHQNTSIAQPGNAAYEPAALTTNRNLASGDHLRLSQLSVGFEVLRKGARRASVWVGGQNLLVTGNYRGFDPNVSSLGASPIYAGRDASVYPVARVWQLGLRGQF